ncbi:MAG: YhjD/YihY/BrkB family envelope integrity protein [Burkholderiaceae bacterium]
MLLITLLTGALHGPGADRLMLAHHSLSLGGFSRTLLYLPGIAGVVFVLTSIHMIMRDGRPLLTRALIGAICAVVLWEMSRHVLGWHVSGLSPIGTVYESLTAAIAMWLGLHVAATLLLFGAQLTAESGRCAVGDTTSRGLSTHPT